MKTWLMVSLLVSACPLTMLGVYFGFMRGEELARNPLMDGETDIVLPLGDVRDIELWTEVTVHAPNWDSEDDFVSELPHVLDYVFTIEQNGQVVAEHICNPFDVHFFDWTTNIGDELSYVGRLDGCDVQLRAAAPLTIRMQRRWLDPTWQTRFAKTELIVRAPGML